MNKETLNYIADCAGEEGIANPETVWQTICWLHDYGLLREKAARIFAIRKLYPQMQGSRADRIRTLAAMFDLNESQIVYSIQKISPPKRTTLLSSTP